MPTEKPKNNAELRDLLLETIEGVKAGSIDAQTGRAIAELSKAVIQTDKLNLEAMVFAAKYGQPSLRTIKPLAVTHQKDTDDDAEEIGDEDEEEADESVDGQLAAPKPSNKPTGPKKATGIDTHSKDEGAIITVLKNAQPLELEEIQKLTGIPQVRLFNVLSNEELFERDTDRLYWLAK